MEALLTSQSFNCQLDTQVREINHSELNLWYRFTDNSNQNAYVFNKYYTDIEDGGTFLIEPNMVSILSEKDIIVIAKKIVQIPPNMLVEKPYIPCVTKVEPGNFLEETLKIPLPLKVITPYSDNQEKTSKIEQRRVVYELAFFLAPPEGNDMAEVIKSSIGPALRFDPFPISSQLILRTGPFSEKLPFLLGD